MDQQQHDHHHDVFIGRQLPNGWFVGQSVDLSGLGAILLLVAAAPFIAARWLLEHGGPIALVGGIAAAVWVIWWLFWHPIGRVVGRLAFGLVVGAFFGGAAAFVIGLLWAVAGVFTH